MLNQSKLYFLKLLCVALFIAGNSFAQPITGVWKGKVNNKRVELKLIQKGDSITGTSYYPGLLKGYTRYSIKGYFDPQDNSIVWWNERLIYPPGSVNGGPRDLNVADYNCPGGSTMFLTSDPLNKKANKVDLTKVTRSGYEDEWDFVLDNYGVGTNNPAIVDSVYLIAFNPPVIKTLPSTQPDLPKNRPFQEQPKQPPMVFLDRKEIQKPAPKKEVITEKPTVLAPKPAPVATVENEKIKEIVPAPATPSRPLTNKEKFAARKKEFAKEIPVSGDSILVQFYDNAEVDGDSISLFLNNKLLFEHIRLTSYAYNFKLAVKDLGAENELVMLAENLGSIPPNTAYMVIMVGGVKYDAQIVSTETSSALIKLRKE